MQNWERTIPLSAKRLVARSDWNLKLEHVAMNLIKLTAAYYYFPSKNFSEEMYSIQSWSFSHFTETARDAMTSCCWSVRDMYNTYVRMHYDYVAYS